MRCKACITFAIASMLVVTSCAQSLETKERTERNNTAKITSPGFDVQRYRSLMQRFNAASEENTVYITPEEYRFLAESGYDSHPNVFKGYIEIDATGYRDNIDKFSGTSQFDCLSENISFLDLYRSYGIYHLYSDIDSDLSIPILPTTGIIGIDDTLVHIKRDLDSFFDINACIVLYDNLKIDFFRYPLSATTYAPSGYDGTIFLGVSFFAPFQAHSNVETVNELYFLPTILAHEYAHIYTDKNNFTAYRNSNSLHNRTSELIADYLAGFYFAKNGYYQHLRQDINFYGSESNRMPLFLWMSSEFSKSQLPFWMDDAEIGSNFDRYGTPRMRLEALIEGSTFGGRPYKFGPTFRADKPIYDARTLSDAYREGLKHVSLNQYQSDKSE